MTRPPLPEPHLLDDILEASNEEIVLDLYEDAIGYLYHARSALRASRRDEAAPLIRRATAIVVELASTLDFSAHGALAARLEGIYNVLFDSLRAADCSGADAHVLETCETILAALHDAWQQALMGRRPVPSSASALPTFPICATA